MAVARETIIPKAPLARLIMRAGAQRVSQDALTAMEELLAQHAARICAQAVTIAKHAGRKTVTGGDVRIAARQ